MRVTEKPLEGCVWRRVMSVTKRPEREWVVVAAVGMLAGRQDGRLADWLPSWLAGWLAVPDAG